MYRVLCNGVLQKSFATDHELFDYDPQGAAWFARHPRATYFQYDHGPGLHWVTERVSPAKEESMPKTLCYYDAESLPWAVDHAVVVLGEGDSAWNPASPRHRLWGPARVTYARRPDGGVDATLAPAEDER